MIDYVTIYTQMVKSGKISLEKVPAKYRDAVKDNLTKYDFSKANELKFLN